MSIWELYFLTRLSSFGCFMGLISIFSGIGLIFITIFYFFTMIDPIGDEHKGVKKTLKPFLLVFSIASLLLVMVPSEKDLAIILGGYWVTNSEEVKKLPTNVAKTLNNFLEKYQDKEIEKKK